MSINEETSSIPEDRTPSVSPGNYSPVTVQMKDTLGAIFLGVLSAVLLIGWMRAEARNRELLIQLEAPGGDHSLNAR